MLSAVLHFPAGKQIGINFVKGLGQCIVFIHIFGLGGHSCLHIFLFIFPVIANDHPIVFLLRILGSISYKDCFWLVQRYKLPQFGHCHTGNNGRYLAPLDVAFGKEGSLAVAAGQNTCTVQQIDRFLIGHIGNRTLFHMIDGKQILCRQCFCQDLRKLQPCCGFRIVRQRRREDPLLQSIVHIDLIPGTFLHKVLFPGSCQCVNTRSHCYGLGQRDLTAWPEGSFCITAHESKLICRLNRAFIPLSGFHIGKLTGSVCLHR